jgi:long-chain acyl-CoA synthetase
MDQFNHLLDILEKNFRNTPDSIAFHYFQGHKNQWLSMTWSEYRTKVYKFAGVLKSRSISPGDCVAILSSNRPEWIICDLAIQAIGATSIPIFPTASTHDIEYILKHSQSKVLFTDHETRIASVNLKPLIDSRNIFCFESNDFETMVSGTDMLAPNLAAVRSDDLATIVYTSGTTGVPKGVMHSHDNLIAAAHAIKNAVNEGKSSEPDLFFSFLPLSHVAERALVEIGSLVTGSPVVFARKVDTFIEDAVKWRPTILLCVPRLWEKIYERINNGLKSAPLFRRAVFRAALKLGQQNRVVGTSILKRGDSLLGSRLVDVLVGNPLKKRLGFDRVRLFLTGSAPTRPELIKFFGSLGVFIREVYGMTENLCLGHYTGPDEIRMTSCGRVFPKNEVKITSEGEVLFRAPWNFKGYYKDPESTANTLTPDGWLSTGDLGYLDPDGYLYITGRKKELLKTSNGKYVAPVPIEDDIKAQGFVEDAMVVGEGRKFCVALIALSSDLQNELPLPENKREVEEKIEKLIETINHSRARHEQIKRIGVLKNGFTIEAGLLTPSLKLKRKEISSRYELFIHRIYDGERSVLWE